MDLNIEKITCSKFYFTIYPCNKNVYYYAKTPNICYHELVKKFIHLCSRVRYFCVFLSS